MAIKSTKGFFGGSFFGNFLRGSLRVYFGLFFCKVSPSPFVFEGFFFPSKQNFRPLSLFLKSPKRFFCFDYFFIKILGVTRRKKNKKFPGVFRFYFWVGNSISWFFIWILQQWSIPLGFEVFFSSSQVFWFRKSRLRFFVKGLYNFKIESKGKLI